jgi:signal transduction histidine kinase
MGVFVGVAMLDDSKETNRPKLPPALTGLSGRVLMLTVLFVMLSEVLIYVPSIANFRYGWLMERVNAAQLATLALEAAEDQSELPDGLRKELLANAEAIAVALKRNESRQLILRPDRAPTIDARFDLREKNWLRLVGDAFGALMAPEGRIIQIVGVPRLAAGDMIDIVIAEQPLRQAMADYSWRILGLSIVISIITAGLIFLSLHIVLVRPMKRLTENIVAFRKNPEDASRVIQPSNRGDEISVAENELEEMQKELRGALNQKSHLAALGTAVSKINHDLRNILASTQLITDRLATISDPTVKRLAPRLVKSIDRAVKLTTETLKYGKAEEAPPEIHDINLAKLVEDVRESAPLPADGSIGWRNQVADDVNVKADPDQLFRILLNLSRNAIQAMEAEGGGDVTFNAIMNGEAVLIDVADTGGGIPEHLQTHLFEAFAGSSRPGGTGLGLAISRELARAHGGDVLLHESGGQGAVFRIKVPARNDD